MGQAKLVLTKKLSVHEYDPRNEDGCLVDQRATIANHVRFTPNSDRESGLRQPVSLLHPRKQTYAVHKRMSAESSNKL